MLTKKSLPVGTLFMVLVILLALLGVGYALWSETLTISGTVQTGEVDVEFSIYDPVECVDIAGEEGCQPEPTGKEAAADCVVTWEGPDADSNGDSGYDQLLVTINGMYPSWHCKVSFDVTSTGNVPVHVKLPEPTDDIPEWVATDFETCYEDSFQLHQGESTDPCTIDIHFTNDQAPDEDSGPYTFGWTILAHQYNEEPEVITVQSSEFNFSSTGGAGWSCPLDHPYVVGGDDSDCSLPLAYSLAWEPGASVPTLFDYPQTFTGYTYDASRVPPEEGWILQNGGTSQSCHILVYCSNVP